MSNEPLAGRVAIVTGSSRGMGRAIAGGLAAAGADVVINHREDEVAEVAVMLATNGYMTGQSLNGGMYYT